MNTRARIVRTALSVAGALALIATAVPAAHAAGGTTGNGTLPGYCAGNYVGGRTNGPFRLDVFYSSANGGTNCAILYNNAGVRVPMEVKISSTNFVNSAWDQGNYISYAGRVAINGTAGKCIHLWGGASYRGTYYSVDKENAFCG